jgi:membrane carboxypeptidase/penicillin-binding protein
MRRPDTTLTRRMVVLDQMRRNGFLTVQQYDSLKALPWACVSSGGPHRRPRALLPRGAALKLQELLASKR